MTGRTGGSAPRRKKRERRPHGEACPRETPSAVLPQGSRAARAGRFYRRGPRGHSRRPVARWVSTEPDVLLTARPFLRGSRRPSNHHVCLRRGRGGNCGPEGICSSPNQLPAPGTLLEEGPSQMGRVSMRPRSIRAGTDPVTAVLARGGRPGHGHTEQQATARDVCVSAGRRGLPKTTQT